MLAHRPKIWLKKNLTEVFSLFMLMPMMMPMMLPGCHTMGAHKEHEEKTQLIGNKICPVSGQKIDEKTKAAYNYKGKTYNFCCASCIDEFNKDPEKYIKRIEEEKLQEKSKQDEHLTREGC